MDTTSNAGELVARTCASTRLQGGISTEMINDATSATGRTGSFISRGSLERDNTEFCLTIIRREEKHSQVLIVSSDGRAYLFHQFLRERIALSNGQARHQVTTNRIVQSRSADSLHRTAQE